jgi:hypothetical protein
MRNLKTFAFVFCFDESIRIKKSENFDFRYFGRYLLEHELMRYKPIRRLNGDYEKIMKLMNFDENQGLVQKKNFFHKKHFFHKKPFLHKKPFFHK